MNSESSDLPEEVQGGEPPKYKIETVELPGADLHLIIKTDLDKYHGNPANPNQKSYASVAARIEEDLAWIFSRFALHEAAAINYLVELCSTITTFLECSRLERPDFVTSVAQNLFEWPVIITTEPNSLKAITTLPKQLKLGENIKIRPDKMKYAREDMVQSKVVYYCLVIFTALSKVKMLARKNEFLQSTINAVSTNPSGCTISPSTQRLLGGEISKNSKRIKSLGTNVKQAKRALITLLKIPIPSDYVASPEVAAVIRDVCNLPPLTTDSRAQWFEHIVKFLTKLFGVELEENEKLRAVGDSAGDVVVREHCKTPSNEEFNAMKAALRHDADVNGAIRTRIKERLKKALDKFI